MAVVSAWMLASSAAMSTKAGQAYVPSWAARAGALARGAGHPDALSEWAIPSLPLELWILCKGAWHRYASGGAVPLLL